MRTKLDPERWFLPARSVVRRPVFTTGNAVTAFVDGRGYFSDLRTTLSTCDRSLLIAGWRVSCGQMLDPNGENGAVSGETFLDAVKAARARGADVRALLFNVPGTDMPGPFRLWHAFDNREFCDELIKIGGEAMLDGRLARVPASSHHQKFIVAEASDPLKSTAYLGGIDVCYDRWDHPPHDNCPQRQRDFVREGCFETHQPSQPGWHDVQLKIQGPAIAQIAHVFRDRWNDPRPANSDPFLSGYRGGSKLAAGGAAPGAQGRAAIQINLTMPEGVFPVEGGPGEKTIALAQAHAIDQAEHYIYVEDQYVWPCALVERLEAALKRGVRVLLVVARDYDAPGLAVVSRRLRGEVVDRLRAAAPKLFGIVHLERDNGEQIYVHSKLIIIDDRFVSIGSANFNARSLVNDTEIQASIIDTDAVEVAIGGKREPVGRFAHELRCRLWAEHLELHEDAVRDPVVAFDTLWAKTPIAPSRRAIAHVVKHGPINIDGIAEHLTTLISKRMVRVPFITLPPGVEDRSAIKLAVDAALRGPLAAGLIKFMEELLNPDVTSTFAAAERAMREMVGLPVAAQTTGNGPVVSEEKRQEAEAVVRRLRHGRMPKMVDWIDPLLLGAVAVRTIISSTIGQYADQRPMQAAMDECSPEDLRRRHDYSNIRPTRLKIPPDFGNHRLTPDQDGRVWLDFLADLGDGFEATYAMAYLLAASQIEVAGRNGTMLTLPAGETMIFGGDLAYPNATIKEYTERCLIPYDMAFQTETPKRNLFYIAGNHDWYDGLTAFTSVFCTARDRYTQGIGKQIGGWRCHQRRSYFALKMPYDWWLWGVDLGLTDTIDDAQLDYFHTMSEASKPGDNVVIITHAPAWVNKEIDGLHQMTMLARSRGANVPLVLAGDLHHYSRYYSEQAGVHMITSGGGGAFAHATHQLKSVMNVDWAVKTDNPQRVSEGSDRPLFNREEREAVGDSDGVDFTEAPVKAVAKRNIATRFKKSFDDGVARMFEATEFQAPNFYPERWRSRLLVLRNLWLPFHNRRFAMMLGLIYMIFGWVFQLSVADPLEGVRKAQYANAEIACLAQLTIAASPEALAQCKAEGYKKVDETLESLKFQGPSKDQLPKPDLPKLEGDKFSAEDVHKVMDFLKLEARTMWEALLLTVSPKRVVFGMLNNPAFMIMVFGLWLGLVNYVDAGWNSRLVNWVAKGVLGTLHFLAHMGLLLIITAIFGIVIYAPMVDGKNELTTIIEGVALYTAAIVLFGGILGGMVWGIYWAGTSALFGMHMDAFSALGIRNYKNFLRMSFAPDGLTIYPVGIDKIPGRRGWRAPSAGEVLPEHNPLILPKRPLKPKLIEEPIFIPKGPA